MRIVPAHWIGKAVGGRVFFGGKILRRSASQPNGEALFWEERCNGRFVGGVFAQDPRKSRMQIQAMKTHRFIMGAKRVRGGAL